MPPIDQGRIDQLAATLLSAYERADARIQAELQAVLDEPSKTRRRERLRALSDEIDQLKQSLDGNAQAWVQGELRSIYSLGGTASAASIAGASFSFTKPHQAALNYLAERTLSNLLSATKHMQADTKKLVRASSKEATLNKLLTGQTAVQAAKGLEAELKKNAVSAVIYRNGSRHSIKEYADVVLRTVSAVAYNQATIVEAKQNDVRYAILYDGIGCGLESHDGEPKANNLIVALGTARANPISHPRCRRSIAPLANIRSKKQAQEAMDAGTYATTPAQDVAQLRSQELTRGQQRVAARLRARQKRMDARKAS